MDTMKIETNLGKSIISKIINHKLKKIFKNKTSRVDIKDIHAQMGDDGWIKLHLEGDIEIHETDLLGLVLDA